jgi:GTP cyclohydrolase IA
MEEPWLAGYDQNAADALSAGFDDRNGDMVIIRSATVHGMCSHHLLLPFRGIAHVGLFTGRAPVRLRSHRGLIDAICHRFIYQERATNAIKNALITHNGIPGAACVIEAD